jgi:predicted AlkP superfamily pyrophosphatase or phosphodiesterase
LRDRRTQQLLTLLSFTSVVIAAACSRPQINKVLVIGLDGVRPDVLAEVSTPNIDSLISEGFFVDDIRSKAQTTSRGTTTPATPIS